MMVNYESVLESSEGSVSGHPHRLPAVGTDFEVVTPQLFGSILPSPGFCLALLPPPFLLMVKTS